MQVTGFWFLQANHKKYYFFCLQFYPLFWSCVAQWYNAVLRAGWTSRPGRGLEFFTSPPRQDRLWSPPSLLTNWYQGLFPWRQSGQGVKLTTHFHLVPSSRMRWAIPPLPQYPFMSLCSVKAPGQLTWMFTSCETYRDVFVLPKQHIVVLFLNLT